VSYCNEEQIFSRIVHKNQGSMPEIMIFEGMDNQGGRFRKQFWSDYSENIYYSRLNNKGVSVWSKQKAAKKPTQI